MAIISPSATCPLESLLSHDASEETFHGELVERTDQCEISDTQFVVIPDQGDQVDGTLFGVDR